MIKAILIIWIGMGNTQSIAIQKFDSLPECEAAHEAISRTGFGLLNSTISYNDMKCATYAVN